MAKKRKKGKFGCFENETNVSSSFEHVLMIWVAEKIDKIIIIIKLFWKFSIKKCFKNMLR